MRFDERSYNEYLIGHPNEVIAAELKLDSFSLEAFIDEIGEASSLADPEEVKWGNFHYFREQIDFDEVDHDDITRVNEALDCVEGIIGKQEGKLGLVQIII